MQHLTRASRQTKGAAACAISLCPLAKHSAPRRGLVRCCTEGFLCKRLHLYVSRHNDMVALSYRLA
jgi:hypothetical protein